MTSPELSVIVTIVEGGDAMQRCLHALDQQRDAPSFEVIVPFDQTVAEVAALADEHPGVLFLDIGRIEAAGDGRDAFAEHVRYDCRRARGLRAASGRLLAMVEDRGWPRPDWARQMVDLHARHTAGAIGGAIEYGGTTTRARAVFQCDFGRYEPPVESATPDFLSDINIAYKREALEQIANLWRERYQEAEVNWALRDLGLGLRQCSEPRVVQQRDDLAWSDLLSERYHWGRTYGQLRVRGEPAWKARLRACALPLLPPLLFARHSKTMSDRGCSRRQILATAGPLIALLVAWSIGECVGYWEGAGAE